jgi:hypothetical protein
MSLPLLLLLMSASKWYPSNGAMYMLPARKRRTTGSGWLYMGSKSPNQIHRYWPFTSPARVTARASSGISVVGISGATTMVRYPESRTACMAASAVRVALEAGLNPGALYPNARLVMFSPSSTIATVSRRWTPVSVGLYRKAT